MSPVSVSRETGPQTYPKMLEMESSRLPGGGWETFLLLDTGEQMEAQPPPSFEAFQQKCDRCLSHLVVLVRGLLGEPSPAPFPPSSVRTSMSSSLTKPRVSETPPHHQTLNEAGR